MRKMGTGSENKDYKGSSLSSRYDHADRHAREFRSPGSRKHNVTRYFIIKSLSHKNIQLSVEKGIWATQVMNEPILDEAFHNSGRVILIFSVNMSGYFQGYSQMMSSVGWKRDSVWTGSSNGSSPWGRTFKVKWLRLHDLPFQKTLHLKNAWNDFKPVKISRDCQELSPDVGEALCNLIDTDGRLERNEMTREELFTKRPYVGYPYLSHEENSSPVVDRTWVQQHMFYDSPIYQQAMLAGAHNIQAFRGMYAGGCLNEHIQADESSSSLSEQSSKHPVDHSNGKTAGVLSDEDLLDMTYEEYLQLHSRDLDSFSHPVSWSSNGAGTYLNLRLRANNFLWLVSHYGFCCYRPPKIRLPMCEPYFSCYLNTKLCED